MSDSYDLKKETEEFECHVCETYDIPAELGYIGEEGLAVCQNCIIQELQDGPEWKDAVFTLTCKEGK